MKKQYITIGLMALLSTGAYGQATKYVVGEEKTGTWCGWCPYGTVSMAEEDASNPNFIGIAIHNSDPMAVSSYDSGSASFPGFGGYPYAVADRIEGDHAAYLSNSVATRANHVPAAAVYATAYVDGTNLIVTVWADFEDDFTGGKLAAVVTEDHVTGTTSGYAQANYFSGGNPLTGAGHDWQAESNPVPAALMEYDHVARALGNNQINGDPGSLPDSVLNGETHSYQYTVALNSSWNLNNLHIIGMLINPDGTIDNAGKGTISSADVTETTLNTFDVSVYPNPTSGSVNLKIQLDNTSEVSVSIVNVLGEEVANNTAKSLNEGSYLYNFDLSNEADGVYFVKVNVGSDMKVIKATVGN